MELCIIIEWIFLEKTAENVNKKIFRAMILDQTSRKSDRKIIELKFKIELKHGRKKKIPLCVCEKFMHKKNCSALPHTPVTCRVPFERRKWRFVFDLKMCHVVSLDSIFHTRKKRSSVNTSSRELEGRIFRPRSHRSLVLIWCICVRQKAFRGNKNLFLPYPNHPVSISTYSLHPLFRWIWNFPTKR